MIVRSAIRPVARRRILGRRVIVLTRTRRIEMLLAVITRLILVSWLRWVLSVVLCRRRILLFPRLIGRLMIRLMMRMLGRLIGRLIRMLV